MPKTNTESPQEKAVKALEAAVKKAGAAGIDVKLTYTLLQEDGGSHTERLRCLLADR